MAPLARWFAITLTLALANPALSLAATPAPSRPGGDTRSSGEGPGLVGEPLVAILLVLAIGLVSLLATLAYVRLTAGRPGSRPPGA